MDNYPLVSIITGYYNRKENLRESVQSVLDQDYPNFEYIIFDDCSTDGTRELLEEFNDPRLKLFRHKRNLGFVKGLIAAIHRTNGKYIALHGAGDVSLRHRISRQVELIEKTAAGMVGCTFEDIYPDKKIVRETYENFRFSQGEILFDKEIYLETGGYNKLLYYGQFTQLKKEFQLISKLDSVIELSYRRINYSNGTNANSRKMFAQRFFVKSGKHFSTEPLSLKSFNKEELLKDVYGQFYLKNIDKQFFFENFSGNSLLKWFYWLHYKSIVPDVVFKLYEKFRKW